MNKNIMIVVILLSIFVVGCTTKTNTAYFDMSEEVVCHTQDALVECNNICDTSGIRINGYQNDNSVKWDSEDGCTCKCY